jgi:hypothetical protein
MTCITFRVLGLLFQSHVINEQIHSISGMILDRKTIILGERLSQCHIVLHRSNMYRAGWNPGLCYRSIDHQLEPWNSLVMCIKLNAQVIQWPAAGSCLQCLTQEEMNVCAPVTKLACVCSAFLYLPCNISFEIRALSKVGRKRFAECESCVFGFVYTSP